MPDQRFITIHGHFYQPPRENPWLEAIETQDSAHPYHDWNERITAECYAPNASARILDARDRILRIVNNYLTINFNVGPTLISWLETCAPETYRVQLPSGRSINIFFYDGPISRAVAFEKLLARGENFANRLISAFNDERKHPQIVNIATDGETYGHHHKYGDMALAYALHYIEENDLARIVNYSAFLAEHPPQRTVEIIERTAWSCAHGVERWRSDCGCSTGGDPGWNQQWRQPLREGLDWLRDEVADLFERRGGDVLRDPWAARDDYIDVVLDRSDETLR